jgi:hypothetical protein
MISKAVALIFFALSIFSPLPSLTPRVAAGPAALPHATIIQYFHEVLQGFPVRLIFHAKAARPWPPPKPDFDKFNKNGPLNALTVVM